MSRRLLMDTHTWVWWVSGSRELSKIAKLAIDQSLNDETLYVSSISVWEVAMLVQRGRLALATDLGKWLAQNYSLTGLHFVSVDNRIALESVMLNLHPDPADRMIVATTAALSATLVTKDKRLQAQTDVPTLW